MIESHPDNALEDLRLDQPFEEFTDHLQSYDLASMDKKVCVWVSAQLCTYLCQFKLVQFYTPGRLTLLFCISFVGSQSHTVGYCCR